MKTERIWQIFLVLLAALAGAYANNQFDRHQIEPNKLNESKLDDISTINYFNWSSSDLKSAITDEDQLEFNYRGKPIKELSSTSYYIENNTQKNLDKQRFYFEVSDKDQQPIFYEIKRPLNYPKNSINLISRKDGLYIFELDYFNIPDAKHDGFRFDFYFASNDPPEVVFSTGSKGIKTKKYSQEDLANPYKVTNPYTYTDPDFFTIIKEIFPQIIGMTILILLIFLFRASYENTRQSEFEKNIRLIIGRKDNLSDAEKIELILNQSKNEPSIRRVLNHLLKINNSQDQSKI